MKIEPISSRVATEAVVREHYLHRRPPISYAYGLMQDDAIAGVITFGVPASRHLQKSACPSNPSQVIELNRLWVHDDMPRNTESAFIAQALGKLPPRIVVSYADPVHGHMGYIYRASNFHYAGWTDMERKTPRYDYVPADPGTHTRDAFRNGYVERRRRVAKVKYWTVTGNKADRRALRRLCPWPVMDWRTSPPPAPDGFSATAPHRAITQDPTTTQVSAY